ncbi:hypothetical protein MKX01_042833 [Papaver californicum]|nr:hypothetical protein MKX01_012186 [Papaver californicum]KAI3911651.1 hypothetical protein MKX01_042833 [Papaver californicum]
MVNTFSRSLSGHYSRKSLSFGSPRSPRVGGHRKTWVSRSFHIIVGCSLLITFVLATGCGYLYVFPSLTQAFHGYALSKDSKPVESIGGTCDLFEGNWEPYIGYPLYNSSECPFAEPGFNCLANGRKDIDYLKWRWKPKNCDVPVFDVSVVLERLRGKRIVFVGDSMSRTQWESLICLLMTGVEDKKSIYEVNGNKITKQIRFLGVKFSSFNFTVEFFRSVFLVQHGWVPRIGPKRVRSTLKLDKLDDISKEWIDSDVLIFNTGQWWTTGKLFDTGCYFQVGKALKLGMSINAAYKTALDTWASWVETTVNTNRTKIFFRSFEPSHWSHWSDQSRRSCNVTQFPMSETEGRDQSPFSDIISEVVKNMTVPVTVLQVTSMGAFRSDAHVGPYSDMPAVADCSHWCLPGVPDVWNEFMVSFLLADDKLAH